MWRPGFASAQTVAVARRKLGQPSPPPPSTVTSKTHHSTLGVALTATQNQIKSAYRKLARRFQPDLDLDPTAQERFKDAVTPHEAPAAAEPSPGHDAELAAQPRHGRSAVPREAGWQVHSKEPHDASMQRAFRDFFATTTEHWRVRGANEHGVILIELADAYRGVLRPLSLQMPAFDSHGALVFRDLKLEVRVPKGALDGQHLRLKGMGAMGQGGAPAGDLYLEVIYMPHPPFRLDARDVCLDLPVAPWEAVLGATVTVPTPTGSVQLVIPPGSGGLRRMRLQGQGLPGSPPGDLYVLLDITLPPGDSARALQAWGALAGAFPDYRPRG